MDPLPDAFKLQPDGSAVDPHAFVEAIKADSEKLAMVQSDPEVSAILLDGDMASVQRLLKEVYQEEAERRRQRMSERSIDAQRASATVPRDTVQLYEQLRQAGLQYGPAFRLLRNVHVPDVA